MQGCRKSLELGPGSWSSSRRGLGPCLGLLGVAPSSAVELGVPRGIFPTSPCALSSAAIGECSWAGLGPSVHHEEERNWLCPAGFQQPWAVLSPAGG